MVAVAAEVIPAQKLLPNLCRMRSQTLEPVHFFVGRIGEKLHAVCGSPYSGQIVASEQ